MKRAWHEQHFGYYLALLTVLLLGCLLALVLPERIGKIIALYITIFFYMVVGIAHHLINHDLSSKLVIEYVLIGSIAMVLVLLLL